MSGVLRENCRSLAAGAQFPGATTSLPPEGLLGILDGAQTASLRCDNSQRSVERVAAVDELGERELLEGG